MTGKPLISTQRVNHVGIVVRDLDRMIDFCSKIFGWGRWERWDTEWPGGTVLRGRPVHYEGRRAHLQLNPIMLQFGETHGESHHTEFLASNSGGLHHISLEVDDLKGAVSRLGEEGIPILQGGLDENGDYKWVYISALEMTGTNMIIALAPPPLEK